MGQSALWPARRHRRGAAVGIRAKPGERAADESGGSRRGEGTTAASGHESAVGWVIHALPWVPGGVHDRVESSVSDVAIEQYQCQQSEAVSTVGAKDGSDGFQRLPLMHGDVALGAHGSFSPRWRMSW